MIHHRMQIAILGSVFVALTGLLLFFPRSTYSELEKRDLAAFPEFTVEKLLANTYPGELSRWFSDSEPYRDAFMTASMQLRDWFRLGGEEAVTFHAAEGNDKMAGVVDGNTDTADSADTSLDEKTTLAHAGILVVGSGANVRALMAFGGEAGGGRAYASALNRLKSEMPELRVYSMVIPLATEFYCPESARGTSRPQKPFIDNIARLLSGVTPVDAYGALKEHAAEDIYLRTDHHWAPLGAYYAARQLADAAGVPFRDLSAYDKRVVRRFVGTMYAYSKDIAVKNAPEDFVYYVPRTNFSTNYIVFSLDKEFKMTGSRAWNNAPFFFRFNDGSGGAYSTFMGGDAKITRVKTGVGNGRRMLIIKDSYGNAVPGYLFFSFEEIHVIDFRYFNKNLKDYIKNNKITDVAAVFNVFNAYSNSAAGSILTFMSQKDYTPHARHATKDEPLQSDTVVTAPAPVPADEPAQSGSHTESPESHDRPEPDTPEAE